MKYDLRSSRNGLLLCSLILLSYGLLILFSATQPLSRGASYFTKQCIWCGVAGVCFLMFVFLPLQKLERIAPWIGVLTVGLLLSVFIPGIGICIKGSRRWIGSGGLRFQPSEPAKVGFILFFSYFLSNHMHEKRFFKGFIQPIACVGVFCALLMLEPDFGTTVLFGTVALLLLFVRGMRWIYILPAVVAGLAIFAVAVYLNPVRFNRILAFLNLEANRTASGYQLWQSLLAFSSGGWFGCGLGQGRQQFFFLPEAHNDFIGAVLTEELGIVHMMFVLLCFGGIAFWGLKITRAHTEPFLFYIGLGTVCFLIIQVFLNLGVITGLGPTKGIALPFLSYGGSNLVTNACFIGLLTNLSRDCYSPLRRLRCKLQ